MAADIAADSILRICGCSDAKNDSACLRGVLAAAARADPLEVGDTA